MGNAQGKETLLSLLPDESCNDEAGEGRIYNGFHGDPKRSNSFFIYSKNTRLRTPRWDTHLTPSQFCTHCVKVTESTYICLGHGEFVDANGACFKGLVDPRTAQTGDGRQRDIRFPAPVGGGPVVGAYHGDPARNHRFWVYPSNRRLIDVRWDTHLKANQFCSNCTRVGDVAYECHGHFGTRFTREPFNNEDVDEGRQSAMGRSVMYNPDPLTPPTRWQIQHSESSQVPPPLEACPQGTSRYHSIWERVFINHTLLRNSRLSVLLGSLNVCDAGVEEKKMFQIGLAFVMAGDPSAEPKDKPVLERFYSRLSPWRRRVLSAILYQLSKCDAHRQDEVRSQLTAFIVYVKDGVNLCEAQQQRAFGKLCELYTSLTSQRDKLSDTDRLFNGMCDLIEDMKDKAFNTVFLEPTKLYFHLCGDRNADVDPHGANTYLALLMFAAGINLNRAPYLHDQVKGVCDVLCTGCEFSQFVKNEMWSDKNFGKPFSAIPRPPSVKLPQVHLPWGKSTSTSGRHFIYPDAHTPIAVGRACCDDRGDQAHRVEPYLNAFTSYFREKFVVERLIQFVSNDDEMLGCADRLVSSTPHLFGEGSHSRTSFRSVMWRADDYTLRMDAAHRFVQLVGIAPTRDDTMRYTHSNDG
eukprot:GHVN01042260.1.p1 GENE.GHVN01042260.1~~GHVN01042260.1.p1  ORF type:complete len:636 (-),score=125.14 GHVN01042260.1:784-2691(-)